MREGVRPAVPPRTLAAPSHSCSPAPRAPDGMRLVPAAPPYPRRAVTTAAARSGLGAEGGRAAGWRAAAAVPRGACADTRAAGGEATAGWVGGGGTCRAGAGRDRRGVHRAVPVVAGAPRACVGCRVPVLGGRAGGYA